MTLASTAVAELRIPTGHRQPLSGRLLFIELRHNIMPWLLPVIATVFWLDSYRNTVGQPPLWSAQTAITIGQGHTLIDFGPFVTGAGAWMGSREGRRETADLVGITSRSRWSGQLVSWFATLCWAIAGYAVLVGVLYAVIAERVSWGGPPWWPVVAGAAGVATLTTLGFVAGALAPGRFVAPLAAFSGFFVLVLSSHGGFTDRVGIWSILPNSGQGGLGFDSGIFYPFLSGLSIARVISLTGISAAAIGALGLNSAQSALQRRRVAVAFTLVGLIGVVAGGFLLSTARVEADGAVIPALDGRASAIAYTPVCSAGEVPVCLHPAYASYLEDVTIALEPAVREIHGLPGAPIQVTQVAASYLHQDEMSISAQPPVLRLPLGNLGLGDIDSSAFDNRARLLVLHTFLGAGAGPGTLAQQAVQAALLSELGVTLTDQQAPIANRSGLYDDVPGPAKGSPAFAVSARLLDQPATMRAWLAGHLGALRKRDVALDQLP